MSDHDAIADDELEIDLRDAEEVARRLIALNGVCHLLGLAGDEPDDEEDEDDDDADREQNDDGDAGDAFDWRQWLEETGVSQVLTESELELLTGGADELGDDETDLLAGSAIAMRALAWAAQVDVAKSGSPRDEILALLEAVPSPWDDVRPFQGSVRLRSEDEIARAREAAEVLLWCGGVEIERRGASKAERQELTEALSDVASEASAAGIVSLTRSGEPVVNGTPISDLPDEAVEDLVVLNRERLRAFNWLCGLGHWDDPDLLEI